MKKVTSELVQVFWEDGEMIAMLHQNGDIKLFTLKKASKQDVVTLLEIDKVDQHD